MAGIHFMATGGIGGVHRGWEHTLDISADLTEIGRTEVCVVCSGAKSLLDIPATLEMLETRGMPIIGYRTDTLPALLRDPEPPTRSPTVPTTPRRWRPSAAAHWGFARRTGLLVVQPVAAEVALDAGTRPRPWSRRRSRRRPPRASRGPAVTPWVLARLHAATAGRSLAANQRLLVDNAGLAAEIAAAYYAP